MAGDPLATILLIGLGFVELSMSASKLLRVKWIVRGVSVESCKTIAQKALLLDSSEEVRALLAEALREFGFGSLIRAGKP
jgi:signal transduction protein with GAF and PtsI domain